ncbi:MAG: hypothetical protein HC828_22565 [Blastochloris sp.]|nr:hypothetical protein [Blastochloris sp.]
MLADQARRLNRMVSALLDLSRLESGQLRIDRAHVELGTLVHQIAEEARTTIENHTIECKLPDEPLLVMADALRLEQVLQQLIGNAVKFSPSGGLIQIEVQRRQIDACISIIDQGIGIPLVALPHLFDRYYRAPNIDPQRLSGMGLGLYVVKEIVELHGGTIEVASQEGQGSVFTVCLPLTENTGHKSVRHIVPISMEDI